MGTHRMTPARRATATKIIGASVLAAGMLARSRPTSHRTT
jgi:hypothetical protein